MKISKLSIIALASAMIIVLVTGACAGKSIIASLKAPDKYLYPEGTSQLQCIVSVPDSTMLTYKWSCTDGTLTGNGPVITWKAPNKYGDFHIMVVVEDANGNTDKASATIGIVVNETGDQGCSTCPVKR
jgi:hypothetical protein